MAKFLNISTDKTLGGENASDTTVTSQKAIHDFVTENYTTTEEMQEELEEKQDKLTAGDKIVITKDEETQETTISSTATTVTVRDW